MRLSIVDKIVYQKLIFPLLVKNNEVWYKSSLKRPFSNFEEVQKYQLSKIVQLIDYAYKHCSAYHRSMQDNGLLPGDIRRLADLKKLPVLTKKDIIEKGNGYVSDKHFRLIKQCSSGTSGKSIVFYNDKLFYRRMYMFQLRSLMWTGVKPGHKGLWLWRGEQEINKYKHPVEKMKWWAKRRVLVGARLFSEGSMQRISISIKKHKPDFLVGYCSLLRAFSEWVLEKGINIPKLKAVISTGETLRGQDSSIIQKAFSARVFNDYGSREFHHIGFSCSLGHLHILEDVNYLEFHPVSDNIYRVIGTALHNYSMPLIRYDLGDFVVREKSPGCNIGFRIIKNSILRDYNYLVLPSGKLLFPDDFVKKIGNVREVEDFQLFQESRSEIILKVVFPNGNGYEVLEKLQRYTYSFQSKFGFDNIQIKKVDSIDLGPGGKIESVKSKVTKEIKSQ